MDAIMERKRAVVRNWAKEHPGTKPEGRTITTIINPDTRTVDIYSFEGFHPRIRWKSKEAQDAYVKSYKY